MIHSGTEGVISGADDTEGDFCYDLNSMALLNVYASTNNNGNSDDDNDSDNHNNNNISDYRLW